TRTPTSTSTTTPAARRSPMPSSSRGPCRTPVGRRPACPRPSRPRASPGRRPEDPARLPDDLPVGVLAPDPPVRGQVEQVAAADPHLLAGGRRPGQQPARHRVVGAGPVLVLAVVD